MALEPRRQVAHHQERGELRVEDQPNPLQSRRLAATAAVDPAAAPAGRDARRARRARPIVPRRLHASEGPDASVPMLHGYRKQARGTRSHSARLSHVKRSGRTALAKWHCRGARQAGHEQRQKRRPPVLAARQGGGERGTLPGTLETLPRGTAQHVAPRASSVRFPHLRARSLPASAYTVGAARRGAGARGGGRRDRSPATAARPRRCARPSAQGTRRARTCSIASRRPTPR